MDLMPLLAPFTLADGLAVALIIALWTALGWVVEHPPAGKPSVSVLMQDYRRDWLREHVTRQPRIFDATILGNLRQGTTFFASACMISIGGGLAVIGNPEQLTGLAEDLSLGTTTTLAFEIKIVLILFFLANAFLKFVWAHRLFGYSSVVMGAIPNDENHPATYPRAAKAAEINITAAKSFNRGMRSIYFALGALGWLVGPWGLGLGAVVSAVVIWRREFWSQSREVLMQPDGGAPD
ncbi:DUF599 domain-containing protein [Vannielia litorea]|uniref:DUF599 domain-containing protein n=1 Tax=Vannielia litorea TaxID=1217970 RepID=UPI001BCE9C11|nr:DUF599 domain-containing protein [Vannielia litorea]MBS8227628.1 DUF599 domain-containing protein [Vannielia litorea]